MSRKPVFTTFETAKLCHVSPLSIINWVNAGKLPAFRTPGGHRRIRREDLVRFMRENGIPIPDDLREGSGRFKVLVVDDEAGIRDVIAEHLTGRAKAYEVMTAADGFEAGRLMASFRPDVVLLDLRMPGLDGFQVCRTIKADPETAGTIVIAMTGYYSPDTESRISECGAVRCFAKPIDPATLSAYIDSIVEQKTSGSKTRRRRGVRG
ncbi:MAG TPA: response regulator [Candidatus Polarisedimenticolaceae bacterium]|nr:response regulator [Candidatus Polarisedimenticolaceae bacterium]